MSEITPKREQWLEKLKSYRFIHRPKFEEMSDEELEHFVNFLEKSFEDSFPEED